MVERVFLKMVNVMEKKEDEKLTIPENCPPVDYLIIGITKIDAAYIGLAMTVGLVAGLLVASSSGNNLIGIAVFFLIVVLTIAVLFRNAQTENLIDKIRVLIEYQRSQKKYTYEYVNVWEQIKEHGDEGSKKY